MLTEIFVDFLSEKTAKTALTRMRKHYRVALRGSVPIISSFKAPTYHLHVNLTGSGFSSAEFASAVQQFNLHQQTNTAS